MKIIFKEMEDSIKFWHRWSVLFPAVPFSQILNALEFRQILGKYEFKVKVDYTNLLEGIHSTLTIQK